MGLSIHCYDTKECVWTILLSKTGLIDQGPVPYSERTQKVPESLDLSRSFVGEKGYFGENIYLKRSSTEVCFVSVLKSKKKEGPDVTF